MMSKKTTSMWAVIMLVVLISIVVIYPMIFNPDRGGKDGRAPAKLSEPEIPPPHVPPIKFDK